MGFKTVLDSKDPWDASLYDIIIPTDKIKEAEAIKLILENLDKEILKINNRTRQALEDFSLSAQVEVELAKAGHNVGVKAKDGNITLTINKHVLMLTRLEEELKAIVKEVSGVKEIVSKVGPGFHQTDIYRRYDFEIPSKVLLVDE